MTGWAAGAPIASPPQAEGVVDVWSARVDPATPTATELAAYLSSDEAARAGRFVLARDRDRFVVGRAFLRLLLAGYVGARAQDLSVTPGPHGKPSLIGPGAGLSFNLAHSGDLAVCAVAWSGGAVGVDVEHVKPMPDAQGIAQMILSPGELDWLESLPEPHRLRRLYEIWTCKEAVLKAYGCGLDRPLDRIVVTFAPGEPPRLDVTPDDDDRESGRLWLRTFEPAVDHVGAVAGVDEPREVRHLAWRWE